MTRIRFILCVVAVLGMTACTKYQVSGVLEGGASQLAVVQLGNGGTERVDTLDCLAGAFAFDVDYDKPVTILITDLARQGSPSTLTTTSRLRSSSQTWPGKASRPANSFA